MLEISFNSYDDAQSFFSRLEHLPASSGKFIHLVPPNQVHIDSSDLQTFIDSFVIPAIIQFIIEQKENLLILSVVENQFFFTDKDEQQQILHIAQSIMDGERSDIPNIQKFIDRTECIQSALENLLKPNLAFSFESFLTFRLHEYRKRLNHYAEVAIEEYKLEQEYQNFIQFLRDYVLSKSPQFEKIHIIYKKRFIICDEHLQEMPEQDLRKYVDRSLLYHHPMYIDSALLAPLVCMAPNAVLIYTDDPEHGMVQTIQNIFQEKVKIYPIRTMQPLQGDSSMLS
ncbi:putative sporulation protein YtxC [Metabacillus sp. RGM 3146]|uniref:putative sporulation protein YtxC n=1 Tax=Metabacillus sp. RGM 3146 TaxID=3401092 RepID=UPI003B9A43D1